MKLIKLKLYFSLSITIFAVSISVFLISQKTFGADPNLQIEPSPTPPPYCLGPWYESGEIAYGERARLCQQRADEYNARASRMSYGDYPLEQVQRISTIPCRWQRNTRVVVVPPGQRGTIYCPTLDSIVKLTASADRIDENGKFTISWDAPFAISCTLSGKAPETGNFSENFDGTNSQIQGSKTYDFVKRGIYNFQFNCKGYLDNSKSTTQGTVTRTATVFVGDIPPAPKVNLKIEPAVIKKGESATLSWNSGNAISLSINQGIGVVAKQGSIKISPSLTTRYTITRSGEFS